jgi:hypothetical protein
VSTNPTALSTVRKDLRDRLKPLVPARWKIIPNLAAAEKLAVPALYFEFTEITAEVGGSRLGSGHLFAAFDLSIITPQTDVVKAEEAVDAAVLDLILALDSDDQIHWDTARKTRLEGGQLGWRVSLYVLTTTTPTTTPA